jgi:uncharacterized protein (DUF2249 family)
MAVAERVLDVSRLAPPEPFEQAVEALHRLREGDYLRLLHHREPFPLYSFLEGAGFDYCTVPGHITAFEVYIWHRGDTATAAAAKLAVEF